MTKRREKREDDARPPGTSSLTARLVVLMLLCSGLSEIYHT